MAFGARRSNLSRSWQKTATVGIAPTTHFAKSSLRGDLVLHRASLGFFFGARVAKQPQTTSATIKARKIPSCTASRMLISVARHGVASGLAQ